MLRTRLIAAGIAMAGGALAGSAHAIVDPVCEKVPSKQERAVKLAARDARAMQRSPDPVAEYQRSKVTGNLADGWRAIKAVQAGVPGRNADARLADALWLDFWCADVRPAYEGNPLLTFKTLKDAAGHGIPTAMIRISHAYATGEFGQPVDKGRAAAWKDRYFATLRGKR
jgi:hypothetical protein